MPATEPATAVSDSPTSAAAARSTVTSTTGWSAARLLLTWAAPSTPAAASRTRVAASASTPMSSAVTSRSTVEAPTMASPALTSMSVTGPVASPETASRTSSVTAAPSASSTSVSANDADAPPIAPKAAIPVPDPIVDWTVATPSRAMRASSTSRAAASWAASEVPGAKDWVTFTVSWPMSPRRLVSRRGTRASDPPSTANAATRVITGRRSAQARVGT